MGEGLESGYRRQDEHDKSSLLVERTRTKLGGVKVDAEKKRDEEVAHMQEFLEKRYGVTVRIKAEEQTWGGRKMIPLEDKTHMPPEFVELRKEMAKLPPSLIKKIKLREIIVVKDIVHPKTNKSVSIATSFPDEPMHMVKPWPLHHELFHLIDGAMGGTESPSVMDISFFDYYKNETQLNGEWAKLDPNGKSSDEQQANYCMELLNLDNKKRRPVYEQYMATPGGPQKFELMKKWLFEVSDGKLNEQYWKDLEAGKVDEDYWKD